MSVQSPPAEASNVDTIRWAFEMLNTGDVGILRQLWDDGTVERFPDKTCRGADEIAAYFQNVFDAMPDFHMHVVGVTGEGDDVYVHWHLTGTHTGAPFQGIDPTGRRIELDGIDHFVVRDGIVVSNFVVYDQMQFARQIGFVPADGSPGDRAAKTAFNLKTRLLRRRRR